MFYLFQALHIHPNDQYSLHWPWRRGRFNLHSDPGGTISTVLNDLETIWSAAIQSHLDIPLKDLKVFTYCSGLQFVSSIVLNNGTLI